MKIKYILTEITYHNEALDYIGYGIAAIAVEEGIPVVLKSVNDLSTNRLKVEELVNLCNSNRLSILHVDDVVEDFLA